METRRWEPVRSGSRSGSRANAGLAWGDGDGSAPPGLGVLPVRRLADASASVADFASGERSSTIPRMRRAHITKQHAPAATARARAPEATPVEAAPCACAAWYSASPTARKARIASTLLAHAEGAHAAGEMTMRRVEAAAEELNGECARR